MWYKAFGFLSRRAGRLSKDRHTEEEQEQEFIEIFFAYGQIGSCFWTDSRLALPVGGADVDL